MLLPHGTVVALVDGQKFELFRNTGDEGSPELTAFDTPKLDAHNHSAGSHHSSAGNHDGHMVEEDAHAGAAVAWLNSQVLGHKLEHLIVIAAPRTLGEMRRHYHKQTERIILAEIAKDLTGRQGSEILAALREKT
jgi:protein required for attachment to host cells